MRIVATGLSHEYNRGTAIATRALDDVSLTIEEGAFLGVVGHTGSGKSTFILHLDALLKTQEGRLSIGDIVLSPEKKKKSALRKERRLLSKKVGMVFQYPEHQLFAETVFEDVAFALKNFYPELSGGQIEERVRAAVETVGLDYAEIKDKSPFLISGGQKRRVAIAGVIVSRPEVLVLDEPCAGLDPAGKTELWALLKKLHADFAKTVIVVSHDMNDVCENCDQVAMFSHGKMIYHGGLDGLFSKPELIEKSGLELPVTAYLKRELGLDSLASDLTIDGFSKRLAEFILRKTGL